MMDEDMQEALSIQYATSCRVAVLASGRWAIWAGDEPPIIASSLDPEALRQLILSVQAEADQSRAAERLGRETGSTSKSVEELGL